MLVELHRAAKRKCVLATQVINENYELKTMVTSYVYVKNLYLYTVCIYTKYTL